MDHDWRIEIKPLTELPADRDNAPSADTVWIPATVRIQVRSPSRSMITLRTLRLFDVRPKP